MSRAHRIDPRLFLLCGLLGAAWVTPARAEDWPAWGRTMQRNMVAAESWKPDVLQPGTFVAGTEDVDLATTAGLRWVAQLGSQSYGNPTVSHGRVFVGTNNQRERRPGITGDYSLVLAFDEADGHLLWQLSVPKMGTGRVNDWEYLGICSSPTVDGDVVYVVTNRGEVVALDVDGLADGNDGAQDEGAFMAAVGKPPLELQALDADILWSFDMPGELGVFPHNITSSSVLIVGDRLVVTTSNGVDWSHLDLPSPFAPAFVVLDKATGAYVAEEGVGISERTLHANWSSPLYVPAAGELPGQIVFGAGDGFLYGFNLDPIDQGGLKVLSERWRYDGNAPEYWQRDGVPLDYPAFDGPSEFIATPVYAEGLVYGLIGQDPEHGPGVGRLSAVDPTASGDQSGRAVWAYQDITRSISTPAVAGGVIYAADYDGRLHALDARRGKVWWVHDTKAHLWGSPLVVGKRVYLGDEDGVLTVLAAGKKRKVLAEITFPAPIYSSPILANGTLYVATQTHLYAFDGRE
jgi:outer membrane protein assembly factor BamB